jgi:hypothetical protein
MAESESFAAYGITTAIHLDTSRLTPWGFHLGEYDTCGEPSESIEVRRPMRHRAPNTAGHLDKRSSQRRRR